MNIYQYFWVKLFDMSNSLGVEIRKARKDLNISQIELASMCGLKQQEISNYENGVSTPTNGKLDKIAKALGKKWTLI
jgi:transcriptional regulator with XRE-family HTH domain